MKETEDGVRSPHVTPLYIYSEVLEETVTRMEEAVSEEIITENFSELIKTNIHIVQKPNKFQVA